MSNECKFNILRGVIATSNLEASEQTELIEFINHIEETGHLRTADEIKLEIDDLKKRRFLEEMADFMDWKAYRELTRQIELLEGELISNGRM